MQRQTALNIIFNAVGIGLGLILLVYILNTAFITEKTPSCATTYPPAMQFPLTAADGALLTRIDLQARAGLTEWGIAENATIVAEGPRKAAIEVKLDPVETGHSRADGRANGIEFRWNAPGFEKATAACLSYSVWLPEDFAFAAGGVLPGIYGGETSHLGSGPAPDDRFGTRVVWRAGGEAQLNAEGQGEDFHGVSGHPTALPRGRWTRLDQEIVLNKIGEANGVARLWLDGEPVSESTNLTFLRDESGNLAGVLADIGYVREPGAPQASTLRISPFELSWR